MRQIFNTIRQIFIYIYGTVNYPKILAAKDLYRESKRRARLA